MGMWGTGPVGHWNGAGTGRTGHGAGGRCVRCRQLRLHAGLPAYTRHATLISSLVACAPTTPATPTAYAHTLPTAYAHTLPTAHAYSAHHPRTPTPLVPTCVDPFPLPFHRTLLCSLASVFIEDNQGGEDVTRLCKIALMGSTGEVFNVAEIKKQEDK